jgi:cytochrome c peroxidase
VRLWPWLLLFVSLWIAASGLDAEERAKVLQHGPWPPPLVRDAGNPVSGNPAAIALGERLFFEPRLSGNGAVLCATCHVPFRRFQDGRARAVGLAETERNTPTLLDVRFQRRFGWDGREARLWAQSVRPLLEPREMNASAGHVAAVVRQLYAADFEKVFGHPPGADDERLLSEAGKALAAFQETLVSPRTPFDAYRDTLEPEPGGGLSSYPPAARRGLRLFVGALACSRCHAGPLFTSGATVDGRRVPGLRGVAATAPYMHDGRLATLHDAVRNHPAATKRPTRAQIGDLVAFLHTL